MGSWDQNSNHKQISLDPPKLTPSSCIRKETKAIEKRKKLIPTKKYKMKVVARPKSKTRNATTQPPITTPNAPTNLESQKPSQGGTSEKNLPPLENIPTLALAPHGIQSRNDVRESL